MSICMGEEKALLGVKDIGILVGTVEEDANPEALGIGAEKRTRLHRRALLYERIPSKEG